MEHLSDTDLERYYLGMIPDGPELAVLEEYLLICGECVDRAEKPAHYVDMIRAWIIEGNWDRDALKHRSCLLVSRTAPPGAAAAISTAQLLLRPCGGQGLALGSLNDRQHQLSEDLRAFSDRGLRPPWH